MTYLHAGISLRAHDKGQTRMDENGRGGERGNLCTLEHIVNYATLSFTVRNGMNVTSRFHAYEPHSSKHAGMRNFDLKSCSQPARAHAHLRLCMDGERDDLHLRFLDEVVTIASIASAVFNLFDYRIYIIIRYVF